ncbi:UBA-like_superfamily [Hexamita inflata]|uniref:UBA-like superfamily n=1 Tax=Hexamita inflata TaxID=28002 RepID=A0AA86QUH1_9EUKA|nr:UBA-like superfamily [Hexamita inflata]
MPGMFGSCRASPYQQKKQNLILNKIQQNQTINGTENKCGSKLFDTNLKKETKGNNEQDLTLLIQSSQKQKRIGLKDEQRVQEYNGGQTMQKSANQMNQSSSALIEQTLQNIINEFMDVTQSTPEQAKWYLKQNKYDVEKALEHYFDQVEQQILQNQNKSQHQTRQTLQVHRQTQVENRSIQQSKEPKQNQQINKFMEITRMSEQQALKYLLQQNYNLDKALNQFYEKQAQNELENTKQSIVNQKQLSNAVSQEYSQMDITQQKEEINNDSEINPQKKSENTVQQENRNNLSQQNKKQNSKIINQNQHDYEKQQSAKTDFQEVLLPAGPDFQHLLKQNTCNHCQNSSAQNLNQVLAQNNGFSNQIFNSSNTFQTSNAVQSQNIPHQFQSYYQIPQSQYQQPVPFNTQLTQQPSSNFSSIPQTNQFDPNALNQNQNNFISTQNPVSNAFNHVQNKNNAFNPAFSISNQNSGFAPITNAAQFASSAFNPSNTFNPTQNPQNFNQNIQFANTLPQSTKINIITLKAEHMKQFSAQIIEFLNKYAQNATVKTNQSGDLNIYTNEREIEAVIQVVRKIVVEEEQIPFAVVVV